MAEILVFHSPLSFQTIQQAVACIHAGGVLAIPTDSYYALAVGAFHSAALKRLQGIKGQRDHKPFPLLISHPSEIDLVAEAVPSIAEKLMQQFWPGLLTLVLKAKPNVLPELKNASGNVGVRQPNDSRVCELLKQTGPLTGTSANLAGNSPAQSAEEVVQEVGSDIDLILDGGQTPGGQPSTVLEIDLELKIIREGAISLSAIMKFDD